jgi:PIN domain nuclease of toxin-antitoxin system
MIILDTHVWIWWVHGSDKLTEKQSEAIRQNEQGTIGISAISLWEIAKLIEYNRVELSCAIDEWFEQALNYPGVRLLELTPAIAVASTRLPGNFHQDPADQIIVATAMLHNTRLLTSDNKIIAYPNVDTVA